MAKNKNTQPAQEKQAGSNKQEQQSRPAKKPAVNNVITEKERKGFRLSVHVYYVAGVALLTWLFLNVCTNNLLTNWDDPGYIKDDKFIKDLSPEGISNIFSRDNSIMGNYHPLTILSYAIEYSNVHLEPWLYHLDSLLFHIGVTLLVYWFVQLLTKRPLAAAIAALLFGLHPMHIESVAWLAGRKDVVYGLFYMAACIGWVYYVRAAGNKKIVWYVAVVLLFICSLLGKPVAVILPVTLFLIDYFENRNWSIHKVNADSSLNELSAIKKVSWNYWILLDKLPLFAISIFFGLQSIHDQKKFGSLDSENTAYNILERIALGAYALISYLWKAAVPVKLCNFYPYPLKVNGALPVFYYIYPAIAAVIIFLVCYFGRKNKVVVFGTLFFLVNIVLLLQFLPVGGAIIADRYTYIPYLGLFFIAAWYVSGFFEQGKNKTVGYTVLGGTLAYILVLGYLSNERCKVWYDTNSLWRDEIEKEPVRAPNAWNNLGFNYFNKYNDAVNPAERKLYYDSSVYFLNEAIRLQPSFVNPYISLGELERTEGNSNPATMQYHFAKAKEFYYKALSLPLTDEGPNAYLGLAIIYAISHNFDSSGFCFHEAIKDKPYFPEAHSNYGNFFDMTQRYDSALVHYGIAIAQNPDIMAPHLNRGRLLTRLGRPEEAMKDFQICLTMAPDNGEVYFARSLLYNQKGNKAQALADVKKARSLGYNQIPPAYEQLLNAR